MIWSQEDHLVRKLDAAIDFSFIYDVVKNLYSPDHGRPSRFSDIG
jgi:hypothetical protein